MHFRNLTKNRTLTVLTAGVGAVAAIGVSAFFTYCALETTQPRPVAPAASIVPPAPVVAPYIDSKIAPPVIRQSPPVFTTGISMPRLELQAVEKPVQVAPAAASGTPADIPQPPRKPDELTPAAKTPVDKTKTQLPKTQSPKTRVAATLPGSSPTNPLSEIWDGLTGAAPVDPSRTKASPAAPLITGHVPDSSALVVFADYLSPPPSTYTVDVANSWGGDVPTFSAVTEHYRATRQHLMFRHTWCRSSCAFTALTLPPEQICVSKDVRFGFHLPYDPRNDVPNYAVAEQLMGQLPGAVRENLRGQGGLTNRMTFISGAKLIAMNIGYHECGARIPMAYTRPAPRPKLAQNG